MKMSFSLGCYCRFLSLWKINQFKKVQYNFFIICFSCVFNFLLLIDIISIENSIAQTFKLKAYKNVKVSKVDPKSVALEMLELTFKDQYLGRAEMWRLKRELVCQTLSILAFLLYLILFQVNSVVYLNKKIVFCSELIRCQVYQMWAQGEKVACGVVSEDTKVRMTLT